MATQPGPWEDYQSAPPVPAVRRGQPRLAPLPTPQLPVQQRNTEVNTARTAQQTQQSDTRGANYQDERSMRSAFEGLPDVRNYHAILPAVESARHVSSGGAGDLDLVYAFAKIMDPGSVVREGEVQMTQNTGGLADRVRGYLQGLRNGQRLPANVRQNLLREIENRASQYRAAYNLVRKNYYRSAEDYGFDPERAVGPDIGEAYQPGPNAPVAAPSPAGNPQSWHDLFAPQGAAQRPPAGLPATNQPGGLTTTDARESAQAGSIALPAPSDNSGTSSDPRVSRAQDEQYTREWAAAVDSGLDRAGLDQWLRENYGRIYPLTPPERFPHLHDDLWQFIEDQRRQARGIQWSVPGTHLSDMSDDVRGDFEQAYHDQAERAQGAEARRQWADEHPILASIDSVGRTAANALTLNAADRVAGTLNGNGSAFEHGVTQQDWQDRPIESFAGTTLGGSRLPYGNSLRNQILVGGAYSGASAFNEADGPVSERLGHAVPAAFVGAGDNALLGGASRAFRAPNADDILAAGERQNVVIPRYMLGRETAQVATGAVGATPGRIPLAGAARRTIEGIEGARNRAASQIGNAGDNISAGRRAQAGARRFLDDSERRGGELFDRVPIPGETQASLTNTRAVLTETTQGLESNRQLSALLEDPQLIRYRDALAEGGLSWQDMKTFRSRVGRMIGRAQVASEGPHIDDLRALYAGLTRDMEATASAQGPRALSMFRRANQYWRGREARREGVIQTLLGRDFNEAPEDAYRTINRWAQRDVGDIRQLTQTMRSLPADDANAVRATIFARMGRSTKGQQDETGEAFSPFVFATQWAGLEPRAKAILVPNAAHRRNLDDIALLATTMRRSERFTNTSNTGLGANFGAFTLGGWMTSPAAAGGAALSTYTLGRLLSTPAGSRSLLRAFRNPEAYHRLIQQQDEESAPEQGQNQ